MNQIGNFTVWFFSKFNAKYYSYPKLTHYTLLNALLKKNWEGMGIDWYYPLILKVCFILLTYDQNPAYAYDYKPD